MRIKCPRCQRPQGYCYCSNLKPEAASTDIIILQHPDETKHPLNTARIAELGLNNCTVFTGEDFAGHTELLQAVQNQTTCLLFPTNDSLTPQQFIAKQQQPELCIVIDGTWRKARKIFYSNPFLHHLPTVSLEPEQASEYRIRKAPSAGALATVEAIVTFLRQTGGNNQLHQPLLDTFGLLIDRQISAMGEAVYQKNYLKKFCI